MYSKRDRNNVIGMGMMKTLPLRYGSKVQGRKVYVKG